ncbi:FAD-dependent monooxygenase [Actinocrispum wychmicini]|uniref:2-polyprenyl-6-methoxyphenol hydroxylase-like FAD-dependent oxidoreductase n=1 Tax=Actinocrispum wychmicini TaxID=1213861 RepID=A0A4R2JXU9_9PSEU|nr:FAD-dependent monooxygenase [Actinocrispum wychmicini]TCO62039.1 2-polyprenyl-6-methoxyphenol hydroxylase-like FAD-dependent oxidoreductase [Actinocrispum wychmicini]
MDVLVVGAGPVGLAMSCLLARRGIRVRLVDAATGPATTSRAIAVHPRTLELCDQLGVLPDMLTRGQVINAFTLHANGRRLARLDADYSRMPTRHPFTLCIDQVRTEQVLRDTAARHGVQVEWDTRLESLSHDDAAAHVVLRRAGGAAENLTVPWLVGCDGGHSTVRKALGFDLVGTSSETWMIADAPVDADLPRNSIHWVRNRGRTMMMVPMSTPGHWRLLDTAVVSRPDPDPAAMFSRELSRGLGRAVRVHEPTWVSVFTFQQRMVTRLRAGRCFVAGDAAHVHSPASGQGLNTGLQDAVNLAWKLAMVIDGRSAPAVLDTYADERIPVGRNLLKSTRTATSLVQLRNAAAGVALPVVFTIVRAVPALRRKIQRKVLGGVSGLNLAYAPGPLSLPTARPCPGPQPGQRVTQATLSGPLLEGTSGWVLVHDGGEAPEGDDWLDVRPVEDSAIRAQLGLSTGDWLLIRPDGYIAARGSGLTPGTVGDLGVFTTPGPRLQEKATEATA